MKKLGRNDPCPCGSGKKFKKCCWEDYNAPIVIDAKKLLNKMPSKSLDALIEDLKEGGCDADRNAGADASGVHVNG